jgi:hypothetical protein
MSAQSQYRSPKTIFIRAVNRKTNLLWRGTLAEFFDEFGFPHEQQINVLSEVLRTFQHLGETWVIEVTG